MGPSLRWDDDSSVIPAYALIQFRPGPGPAGPHTVPRFFPCHGRYHARIAAMSASMSPVG
jgi:hypothetical protein